MFFDVIESSLKRIEEDSHNNSDIDGCFIRLECILRCLQNVQPYFHSSAFSILLESVGTMIDCLSSTLLESHTNRPGRPCIQITSNQLEYLLDHQFTQTDIANMFGCSVRTIHRRLVQYNLLSRCEYTTISDSFEYIRASVAAP